MVQDDETPITEKNVMVSKSGIVKLMVQLVMKISKKGASNHLNDRRWIIYSNKQLAILALITANPSLYPILGFT